MAALVSSAQNVTTLKDIENVCINWRMLLSDSMNLQMYATMI